MIGEQPSTDGVASFAYVPVIDATPFKSDVEMIELRPLPAGVDRRDKPGDDGGAEACA